jgi:hypothetical protein
MSRKSKQAQKSTVSFQSPWLPIIAGGAVLFVIVGLAIWWSSSGAGPTRPPQAGNGAPKLTVDRTTVDDGYVKFETPVQAAFKLSNTGSQPLQILGEPQVELIEGC